MVIAISDGAAYRTSVREGEGPVTFQCSLSIAGHLSEEQRAELASAVAQCPVRRTLSRGFQFELEHAP